MFIQKMFFVCLLVVVCLFVFFFQLTMKKVVVNILKFLLYQSLSSFSHWYDQLIFQLLQTMASISVSRAPINIFFFYLEA